MYGAKELKALIEVTDGTVECPVRNCFKFVARQRKVFKRIDEFKCPEHNIYISPSTFEYVEKLDNILWKDPIDQELLFGKICGVKRETSRFARDNSEDAVTWNVFRYMEKEELLQDFLSGIAGFQVANPEIIYWSYSQSEQRTWSQLQKMREEFEINSKKGSEPDLIIQTDNSLFFIEAKLTATNDTVPSSVDPIVQERYEKGGDGWYHNVFTSDFKTVAIREKKYELLRFWLLGSMIAHTLNQNFFLVNLTTSENEKNIETLFKKYIKQDSERIFARSTWEDIYNFLLRAKSTSAKKEKIVEYFRNKTIGYDGKRRLQRPFAIE